ALSPLSPLFVHLSQRSRHLRDQPSLPTRRSSEPGPDAGRSRIGLALSDHSRTRGGPMILSGELKDFSLADVLQLLLQQRKSGVLVLSDKKENAELFISQGDLAGVRVNGETPD